MRPASQTTDRPVRTPVVVPPTPSRSEASIASPRRTGSFTGAFATVDGLQICEATTYDVACISTPSMQQVRFGDGAAVYEGETDGAGFPLGADALGSTILTPAGISCLRSTRGIECSRGGHGFRIGDWSVVTVRGASEQVYDSPNRPANSSGIDLGASEDLSNDVPVPTYVDCSLFVTRQGALDAYNSAPGVFADLLAADGTVCPSLTDTYDVGSTYQGVDLGVETAGALGSDGYWAETCPGGSCYGAISDVTGSPRTNFVSGYTRADGTVVGSYYRSSP